MRCPGNVVIHVLGFGMSYPIEFDHQLQLTTIEIHNEAVDYVLATELIPKHSPVPKELPHFSFCDSQFTSEFPGQKQFDRSDAFGRQPHSAIVEWRYQLSFPPLHNVERGSGGEVYRQRKIRSAITKLTAPQATTMASGAPSVGSAAPSIITARSASLSAVSGSALTNGIIASGKRAYEKNVPDRIHIGSITRFINPDTPSIVLALLATSNPSPANAKAPRIVMPASVKNDPRTATPNNSQPNPTSATTSRIRNTSRDRMKLKR